MSMLTSMNLISLIIACIVIGSLVQGIRRGASGSARHFMFFVLEVSATVVSLYVSWHVADKTSPILQLWLEAKNITIPTTEIGFLEQMYYTVVTSMRDFPLLRFGMLFLLGYAMLKPILHHVWGFILHLCSRIPFGGIRWGRQSFVSGLAGGILGTLVGIGRALMAIALLVVYTALFPQTPFTNYIQTSALYQKGATEVIAPVAGDFIADKLPVFTRAVEEQFTKMLQRKYEVVDARISDDIAIAAREITANAKTDEEKARTLYKWVGTRVQYDWNKVKLYEEQRIWKEQTPEDTFRTKEGVCIDYSRLYAVMARSIGLDVKVVTGLGYDGRGGYGPHAWNEVYIGEKSKWIPLDSTWVASGGNWFDPPNFEQTHIRDAA